MRSIIDGAELSFFAEKEFSIVPGPKDKPVHKKTPWLRSNMGVAHFGSWAPNAQLYLKRYCKAKTSKVFFNF